MTLFHDPPSWIVASLFVVIPSVLICLAILWLFRKCVHHKVLQKNHDVAGFTLSIVGVLYSVILGFTVINAQSRYNEVQQTIHAEALAVADLYRDAAFFPPPNREEVRASLRSYVDSVIHEEWGQSARGQNLFKTQKTLDALWKSYYSIDVPNDKTAVFYSISINKLNALMEARLSRLFNSWEHLGTMMWILLLIGGLITIGFMFFFGLENLRNQMIMTALLVSYVSFMLYLVYTLDHVFEGPERIKPVALEQVYSLFDEWDQSNDYAF